MNRMLSQRDRQTRAVGSKKEGLIKQEMPIKTVNAKNAAVKPAKRAVFGDVTNATKEIIDDGKKNMAGLKPKTFKSKVPVEKSRLLRPQEKENKVDVKAKQKVSTKPAIKVEREDLAADVLDQITSSQETNESLTREDQSFSFIEEVDETEVAEKSMVAFDKETLNDPFHVGVYAQDIFDYYKRRENMFKIPPHLGAGTKNCHVSPSMRAILVDWLVEIQENFELNHETLYLAVKLTDLYLSRVEIDKESLQLLGAAAVFIAAKFDERCPPLIEDFTYICDNAFDSAQFIEMEMELLRKIDFDIGIPISYRFLRRYAKVGRVPMETLTLARFILEMSLMEYDLVREKDSIIAASALHIARKMRHEGPWEGDMVKTSGFELDDLKDVITRLNAMLLAAPTAHLQNVRCKYSHVVFHEVAKIKPIQTSELL